MAGGIYDESGKKVHPPTRVPPPPGVRVRLTTGTRDTQILIDRLQRMIDQVDDELKVDNGHHFNTLHLGQLRGLKDAMDLVKQHFYGT